MGKPARHYVCDSIAFTAKLDKIMGQSDLVIRCNIIGRISEQDLRRNRGVIHFDVSPEFHIENKMKEYKESRKLTCPHKFCKVAFRVTIPKKKYGEVTHLRVTLSADFSSFLHKSFCYDNMGAVSWDS